MTEQTDRDGRRTSIAYDGAELPEDQTRKGDLGSVVSQSLKLIGERPRLLGIATEVWNLSDGCYTVLAAADQAFRNWH